MSKKSRLQKQSEKQAQRRRLESLEELEEREAARNKESRSAKKCAAAKHGYADVTSVLLTVVMLAAFGYSGFFYGNISVVGQLTDLAENMPKHSAVLFIIANCLMFAGIVLSFAKRYILQAAFSLTGSLLHFYTGHRIVADIRSRLEKVYAEPEIRDMDKEYMRYYYPILIVTAASAAILAIALTRYFIKKRKAKKERENAPVKSIVS